MSWERHKNALIEAAASNDALPLDLRAHLDDCATCRAAFEEERRLLAAIDSSLRAAANAPVPPLLLPTVRLHLAQEDAAHANAKRSPSANWMYLAAAAALILALMPLLDPRRVRESQGPSHNEAATTTATAATNNPELSSREKSRSRTRAASPQPLQRSAFEPPAQARLHPDNQFVVARAAQATKPEVLVPADERIALENYLSRAYRQLPSGTRQESVVLANAATELPTKPLTIEPLQIAQLDLKAMEDRRPPDGQTQTR